MSACFKCLSVTPFFKQLWTVSAVLINMCAQGMLISYPSCLLPALRKPDSIIRPNSTTASWISSCVGLASIPGIIISAYLMSYRGRRLTHGLFIIPGLIGCILISQASCVTTLMIGRILGGFTNGATVSLGAVVIGEFTSPKHRGMFLNLKTAMICFGSMIIHSFGNFLHWKTVALTFVIPHVITILIVLTWPESPAWLASRKEFKKCEESFIWLRGKDENSLKELNQMIKAQTSAFNKDPYFQDDIKEFFRKFTKKDFLKPIGIFIVGGILLEASGRHIFLAYALDIVNEVTGDKSNSFYYTLGIDIIITASSILSSFLMRICPRRTLLFSTGFASVAVVSIVCGYLFLTSIGIITEAYPAIPMGLFVVYFILANLACSPMPLSFVGELFPLAHRGVGAMCCSIMMSVIMYVGLQITPSLLIAVKLYGTFTVFGVTIVLCLMILYFILPETKDRTLQEIEDYFNHGKFMDEADEEVELKMLSDGDLISEVRIVTARQFTT